MKQENQNTFVFVLGREQEIALAELKAVLERFCFSFDIYRIAGNIIFINVDGELKDVQKLISVLGGTVKIYKITGRFESDLIERMAKSIEEKKSNNKVNFAISSFSKNFPLEKVNRIGFSVKKKLKGSVSTRFIELKDSSILSTILSLKNRLVDQGVEFGIFDGVFGILVALSNPEEWSKIDYDKPAFDKYSGMVPPKLARMMVNLALGQVGSTNNELSVSAGSSPDGRITNNIPNTLETDNRKLKTNDCETIVVDPFCGSGNILLAALLLGYDVIGSDISQKAVDDTKKNIEWLVKEYQISSVSADPSPDGNTKYQEDRIFLADATSEAFIKKLTTDNLQLTTNKNFVFVTEPYLGEPKRFKPSYNAAKGEYSKVKEIYINFLKNISNLKDYKSTICIVFPLIDTKDNGFYSLFDESVDEITELGYTQICKPFVYGRDYQVIKREIILLEREGI